MNALVITNPAAGREAGNRRVEEAIEILCSAGWDVTTCLTAGPYDARRLAAEAVVEGRDTVIVAGGDGTINEAIQALAGTETTLGYLPNGTINIWARELGLPLDPRQAARLMIEGHAEQVDLGMAGERYFLLMAGLGFDGEIVRRARSFDRHKRRFGVLPYVASGLTTVPFYRGTDFELRYDGLIRRVQALMIVAGNTRLYGGRFQLTPNAVANDGWLDLCIVKGRGPISLVRQSLPLLLSGSIRHSDVETLRVRQVAITTDTPVPVQVDGELTGMTPVELRVIPRALRAIVPPNFASSLIA